MFDLPPFRRLDQAFHSVGSLSMFSLPCTLFLRSSLWIVVAFADMDTYKVITIVNRSSSPCLDSCRLSEPNLGVPSCLGEGLTPNLPTGAI
jgi:hypothetical protein